MKTSRMAVWLRDALWHSVWPSVTDNDASGRIGLLRFRVVRERTSRDTVFDSASWEVVDAMHHPREWTPRDHDPEWPYSLPMFGPPLVLGAGSGEVGDAVDECIQFIIKELPRSERRQRKIWDAEDAEDEERRASQGASP